MFDCLIGFGSNLGDGKEFLNQVLQSLNDRAGIHEVLCSQPVTSAAIGGPPNQPPYFNAAIRLECSHEPADLLRILQQIEQKLGRRRTERWGARTVDLDLLLAGDLCCESDELTLPHPRMVCRWFVLRPAAEIAGTMRHPACGWSIRKLNEHLDRSPNYFAVGGVGKTTHIASRAAQLLGGRWVSGRHSAGPPMEPPLEFFGDDRERVVELLDWLAENPAALAITDFWLDPGQLSEAAPLPPKLLCWLDAPDDSKQDRRGHAVERHDGPWIRLKGAKMDELAEQIADCVRSMNPEGK